MFVAPESSGDGETVTLVRYVTTAAILRDRLDVLGFTSDYCRKAFAAAVARELEHISDSAERYSGVDGMADFYASQKAFYASITADRWIEAVREIHEKGLGRRSIDNDDSPHISGTAQFMLGNRHDDWLAFPAFDRRHIIRLVLEALPAEVTVEYDLTDLVLGGWVEEPEELVAEAQAILTSEAILADRVIVLTEGTTDKWVLEESIGILAPHIRDYFSFMDFEGAKIAGGAGALANTVKAFVGAGVLNRVVALFDNDTAAAEALRALHAVALPPRFAVIQYPELEWLRDYPTLGPTGLISADVNGVAGSIELYLGRDVLQDASGKLRPVQWRGYNAAVGRYQGEVMQKREIHQRFREKLAACRSDSSLIGSADWSGLQQIIQVLKTALAQTAGDALIEFEAQPYP